jgi:hypothetical protein
MAWRADRDLSAYIDANAELPEKVHQPPAKWPPLHPWQEAGNPPALHPCADASRAPARRALSKEPRRRPRAPPAREGDVPRPVSPPELLLRDCASAGMCSRIGRLHGAGVVFALRSHRPGADASTAGPGAGPAQPVCRSCGPLSGCCRCCSGARPGLAAPPRWPR